MKAITYSNALGTEFAVEEIPASSPSRARGAPRPHRRIAEFDDELMETYLEDESR